MELNYNNGIFSIYLDAKLKYDEAVAAHDEIFTHIEGLEKKGDHVENVIIDADKLLYISSAGIRILVELRQQYSGLRILNVSQTVYETISITGLEDMLGIELKDETPADNGNRISSPVKTREKGSDIPSGFTSVVQKIEAQAELHPDKTAVVSSKGSYSYRELNETANKVANSLIFMDAAPEDIVCIMLERGIEIYAATIGVLKAGCAYVIVNPKYPDERIEYIYRDSGAKHIISSLDMVYDRLELFVDSLNKRPLFFEHILNSKETDNPDLAIYPENLCYIIYTSGSTGKPKGVMIEHGNLSNFLIDDPENREFLGLAERSKRCLAMAQMTFDVSVMEEYIPLVTGNTVVMTLYDEIANPAKMIKLMLDHKVDGADFTPSYLLGLMKLPSAKEAVAGLKVIDFGAEAFPGQLYSRIRECNPDVYIMNGYGPTETTISCTMKVIDSPDNITIGIPNANVDVYIIDENGEEVPEGEIGELLICGKGVGRGYINPDERSAAAFTEYKGRRAYKSGDLCRINEDGEIEYFGRKDLQVKIRGLRIELGEVEAVFNKMEGIDTCVAASFENRYLCLYYTSAGELDTSDLRAYAKQHLAHYMLPDIYMRLDEIPMTDNKKADRKALPKPQVEEESIRKPETDMQRRILELLCSIVTDRSFGIDQNLPESGLSSLDVMLFISLIGSEYNIGINIGDFVNHPTVMDLEKFIQSAPKINRTEMLEKYHATDIQITDYNEALAGKNDLDIPSLYELDVTVDTDRLKDALMKVIAAHPGLTLRLEPDENNTLYQIPQDDYPNCEIRTSQIQDNELEDRIRELCTPIPPNGKWLFRFEILETPTRKYLFANYNHLNSDGESISIAIEDIIAAYEGKELEDEQLSAMEYGEYLHGFWETKAGKHCIDMYMKYFETAGGATTYPPDRDIDEWIPKHLELPLSVTGDELRSYCKTNHFTESVLLAGALGLVLADHTGHDNAVFSFGYSGRNDSRLSNSIGYIATLLEVFCFTGKHDSYRAYLKDFNRMFLNVLTFPCMPFMKVLEKYPNAIDIIYLYQPYSPEEYTMDGKRVKSISLRNDTVYESKKLIVQPVQQKDGSIIWQIDYQGNLYSDESMNNLARDLNKTVRAIINGDTMHR